jgi:hypothetical protein
LASTPRKLADDERLHAQPRRGAAPLRTRLRPIWAQTVVAFGVSLFVIASLACAFAQPLQVLLVAASLKASAPPARR